MMGWLAEGENLTKNLLARPRSGALGEGEELEFGTSPGVFSAQKRPVDRDTVEGNSPHEGDASSRLRPEGCQLGIQAVAPGAPARAWRAIQIGPGNAVDTAGKASRCRHSDHRGTSSALSKAYAWPTFRPAVPVAVPAKAPERALQGLGLPAGLSS